MLILFFDLGLRQDGSSSTEVLESLLGATGPPELKTVWSIGLRLIFDWRHYL